LPLRHPLLADGWSAPKAESLTQNDLKDRLVQLYFQIVRFDNSSKNSKLNKLISIYSSLIRDTINYSSFLITDEPSSLGFISHMMLLLRAIPTQTRDIESGKGERTISYHLLLAWQDFDIDFVIRTIKYWVGFYDISMISVKDSAPKAESVRGTGGSVQRPPGSWKDIRNICNILRQSNRSVLIDSLLELYILQLKYEQNSNPKSLSLVSKWIPREGCKHFGWIFRKLAVLFYPPSNEKATSYSYKLFRKLIADFNRMIDTTEIKMCSHSWSSIDFSHIPSITFQKQKRSFANLPRKLKNKNKGIEQLLSVRYSTKDRIDCAAHFETHISKAQKGEVVVKASKTSLYDMVRDAFKLKYSSPSSIEYRALEEQWKDNSKIVKSGLPPMICIADVSGSMTCDNNTPLYYCIGLSLRACEKTHSSFANRVLTFTDNPSWFDFDSADSFISRVSKIMNAPWGSSTDIYKALQLILNTFISEKIPPSEVENIVLAIFSDMQFNVANPSSFDLTAQKNIQNMFDIAGYKCPHILFWNLRTTDGFPAASGDDNITMLSGYSPTLLNILEEVGIDGLKKQTPFLLVSKILENPRFISPF
jgi:hypothetical protein